MKKSTETLEQLDQALRQIRITGSPLGAKNEIELLAWHLKTGTAFNIQVLLGNPHPTDAGETDSENAHGTNQTDTASENPNDSHLTDSSDTASKNPYGFMTDPEDIYSSMDAEDKKIPGCFSGKYMEHQNQHYGKDFTFENQELCHWLLTTPLENVAAYTAHIVREQEFNKVNCYYDAAQDLLADNWHEWDDYEAGTMSGRQFVDALKAHVDEISAHVAEGKKLGLTMNQIILHDSMWGLLPSRFDSELAEVANVVLAKAEAEIAAMRPYIWSKEGKRIFAPKMLNFAGERLQEIGIDIGLHQHYTTEQGYLLEYFSRMYWQEAASRPED